MLFCELHINDPMEDKIKRLPSIVTKILKKIAFDWHKDTLPKHFKRGAARRYKYKPRSVKRPVLRGGKMGISYVEKKRRKGLPALVWSGRARDKLTSPIRFKITGSKKSVKGRFIAVDSIKYFWMTPAGQPNKAAEAVRIHKDEEKQIGKFLQEAVVKELEKRKVGRKKIVR